MCGFWGAYFYLANLTGDNASSWFGRFCFDSSEIPIITIYALYIPIFIMWMAKAKNENVLKRFVVPVLAICGSLFMVYASINSHGIRNLYYLIVFAVVMIVGMFFYKKNAVEPGSKKAKSKK